jgi:D-serine dehydratase
MAYDFMDTLYKGANVTNNELDNASKSLNRFQDILMSSFSLPMKAMAIIEDALEKRQQLALSKERNAIQAIRAINEANLGERRLKVQEDIAKTNKAIALSNKGQAL